jgi:hypothetical protein
MKRSIFIKGNADDLKYNLRSWIVATSIILVPFFIPLVCHRSYAVPDLAKVAFIKRNGIIIRPEYENRSKMAHIGDALRQYRDHLEVPGTRQHWVHLKFSEKGQPIGYLVQVGPAENYSSYTFPCKVEGHAVLGFKKDNIGENCHTVKVSSAGLGRMSHFRPLKPIRQASAKLLYAKVPADLEKYYCGATPTSTMGQGKFSVGSSPEDACQRATEKCQINLGGLVADNSSTPPVTTSSQGGGEVEQQFENKKPISLWEDNLDSSNSTRLSQTNSNNPCSVANLGDWRVDEPELTVSMLCQNRRSDDSSNRYSLDSITTNGSSVETQLLSLEQKYSGTYLANCEPIVYSRDEIVFAPVQDNTLVQTKDEQGRVVVDVLVGAINLMSADFPNGKYVEKGFQYTQGEKKPRPIEDCAKIRESEGMQIFMDPDNWLEENGAQMEGISSQLEAYKANFCQSSKVEKKRDGSFPIIIPIPIFPGGGYGSPGSSSGSSY